MHAHTRRVSTPPAGQAPPASDELRVAITLPPRPGSLGLTKFEAPLSTDSVREFAPLGADIDRAIHGLSRMGFRLTQRGRMSVSMRVSRADYEKAFGTSLTVHEIPRTQLAQSHRFYFPAQGAPWNPDAGLTSLIDDAYIQWPHIYLKTRTRRNRRTRRPRPEEGELSATPPTIDYHHLEVLTDLRGLLNVPQVHRAGVTGKGVRVVMVDTGFAHTGHPFFGANRFKSTVDLAPRATHDDTDPNGHGTGESANIFSVAPDATFIGIKLENDDDRENGSSMLEGFQAALQHSPDIISMSLGYDLRDNSGRQLTLLPNSLAALEAEIEAAIASGITVVISAGNGHFSFPGMMPDVISAGGVFADARSRLQASDYASAFDSRIYSGRHVPDFCGLVGMLPHAAYIMLPIPGGCEIDREESAAGDKTAVDDGWGVFSGTSAAAPQLAGVCALLLQKNRGLKPADIKAVLRRTARHVTVGHANPASSDTGEPMPAGPGDRGACGAGLIDAFAALQQV